MVYRKEPDERYDGNGNLKAEFRTPGIMGYISRARQAGIPGDQTDFRNGEDAVYAELILRIEQLSTSSPWHSYEQSADYEDMLWVFLDGYGIRESEHTGQLIPRKSHMLALLGRIHDKKSGRAPRKLLKRECPELTVPYAWLWARDKNGNLLNQTRTGRPRVRKHAS